MASEAQIKARENFVKNYAGKKKGSKSTKPKTNTKKDKKRAKSGNKTDIRLRKLKAKKGKK